jgi:hypothetical protein
MSWRSNQVLVQAPNELVESVDAVLVTSKRLVFGQFKARVHCCLSMRAKSVGPRLAPDAMHDAGVFGTVPLCTTPAWPTT